MKYYWLAHVRTIQGRLRGEIISQYVRCSKRVHKGSYVSIYSSLLYHKLENSIVLYFKHMHTHWEKGRGGGWRRKNISYWKMIWRHYRGFHYIVYRTNNIDTTYIIQNPPFTKTWFEVIVLLFPRGYTPPPTERTRGRKEFDYQTRGCGVEGERGGE